MTIANMGCHPLSVITAITVQDTSGVHDIFPLRPEWVAHQANAILNDIPVHVFKLGLLGSDKIIHVIAEILLEYPQIPVVMDPVLASGRGDKLATKAMIDAMRKLLLPRATLLTPNSIEARRLAFTDARNATSPNYPTLEECAFRLLDMGCKYVLITGAHENTAQVINSLFTRDKKLCTNSWKRLPHSYHGSGCTLASAIAASIAAGQTIHESVLSAQSYTWHALKAGFRPGLGQFIPDRYSHSNNTEKCVNNDNNNIEKS